MYIVRIGCCCQCGSVRICIVDLGAEVEGDPRVVGVVRVGMNLHRGLLAAPPQHLVEVVSKRRVLDLHLTFIEVPRVACGYVRVP